MPLVMSSTRTAPAGEPKQRGRVGEHPDDVGAPLDLLVEPLSGLVDQTFFQCGGRKSVNASSSSFASRSMVSTAGNWRPSIAVMTSSWPRTCSASGWANTGTHALERPVQVRYAQRLARPETHRGVEDVLRLGRIASLQPLVQEQGCGEALVEAGR